jgi:hypothetical protein
MGNCFSGNASMKSVVSISSSALMSFSSCWQEKKKIEKTMVQK